MPLILHTMFSMIRCKTWTLGVALTGLFLLMAGCRKPEAPVYYGFQDIRIGKLSGQQTVLSTTLKFYNPNPFSLELKRAEMDVSLNGKLAGHCVLDSTLLIPQKDTFFVPVSVLVDLKSVFGNVLQVLLEKQATVALDGRVKIRRGAITFSKPFHYEGKQDISSLLPSGF
jgi:LEA14-like dessication related protein